MTTEVTDYEFIVRSARSRKPVPGYIVADALEDTWADGGSEMTSKTHSIVEAVRLAGVVCHDTDEILRVANAMSHASYAGEVPF